jgi:hypothetical protein
VKKECTLSLKNAVLIKYLIKKRPICLYMCPFNEEEIPSCKYDPFSDRFLCHKCGERGDGEKLAKKLVESN